MLSYWAPSILNCTFKALCCLPVMASPFEHHWCFNCPVNGLYAYSPPQCSKSTGGAYFAPWQHLRSWKTIPKSNFLYSRLDNSSVFEIVKFAMWSADQSKLNKIETPKYSIVAYNSSFARIVSTGSHRTQALRQESPFSALVKMLVYLSAHNLHRYGRAIAYYVRLYHSFLTIPCARWSDYNDSSYASTDR